MLNRLLPALAAAILITGCTGSLGDGDQSGQVSPSSSDASTDGPKDTAASTTAVPSTPPETEPPPTTAPPTQMENLATAVIEASPTSRPTRVGLVAHLASVHPEGRTIDLLAETDGVELTAIFAPEHGLAGTADAGELVADGVEPDTGTPVFSLYGERRQPSPAELEALDVLVYDLQDVGVRAYTYIATMGLVLDAATAVGLPVLVVDRANPQGAVADGPLLVGGLESFVSPYPIPPAYGLSSGELALMIVGEGWVAPADLTVIGPRAGLNDPWIAPSPNLPTLESTWLYPAIVAFEATTLSVGRGTPEPFTLIGTPSLDAESIRADAGGRKLLGLDLTPTTFTPEAIPGMATNPKYRGQRLVGLRLAASEPLPEPIRVTVELLDAVMDSAPNRAAIIDQPSGFDRLIGDPAVREALLADTDPGEIAASWADDLTAFSRLSAQYRG